MKSSKKQADYLVQTNLDSLPDGGHNVRLDYTLRVPYATSTEITAEHGDVVLDGLKAEQAVTAHHGDAHIDNVEGLVHLGKGSGMTEVRDLKGSVDVEGRGSDVVYRASPARQASTGSSAETCNSATSARPCTSNPREPK